MAAQGGRIDIVRLLLQYNADPDKAAGKDGSSPMYAATIRGDLEVVKELLNHNADPTIARPVRKSPLATNNLLEDTDGCGSPLLLLTCALLMTSSHSEGPTPTSMPVCLTTLPHPCFLPRICARTE